MGQRANFVLIENGVAKLYGGSWSAADVIYRFAAGPLSARENAVAKWEADRFYDWGFAEGGYLLDFEKRLAIIFGDPIPIEDARKADLEAFPEMELLNAALAKGKKQFLEYVSTSWPDWIIVWDDRGVDAFSSYLVQNDYNNIPPLEPNHPKGMMSPVMHHPNSNSKKPD